MIKISKLLPQVIKKRKLDDVAEAAYVLELVRQYFRVNLSYMDMQEVYPAKYLNSHVYINVANSNQAQELNLLQLDLVNWVNEKIGRELINKVVIKQLIV